MPYKVHTYLGSFGSRTQKPIMVYSSNSLIHELQRARPKKAEKLTEKKNGKVNGRAHDLKRSQAYPKRFGKAVALVIKRSLKKSAAASTRVA